MQASYVAPQELGVAHSGSGISPGSFRSPWRRDLVVCLLLGLAFFLIYNANLRSIDAGDTYPARYLPLSILKYHTLALDPVAPLIAQGRSLPVTPAGITSAYWILRSPTGRFVSLYPIVTPVVVAPLYLPAVLYLDAKGWDPKLVEFVARIMEKLVASFIASLSAMLLYLLLRRRCPPTTAALLTVAYALGTTTWVISSQTLWMHGLGELLVVAMLYVLTGRCTPLRALGAGLACALLACNRQPDTILAAGFALYAIRWAGPRFALFLAAAAVPVGLMLAYNLLLVGHIIGGYGLMPTLDARVSRFGAEALFGIGLLLFSPVYGIFVFSPFLLFVPLFLKSVLRDRRWPGLTLIIGAAVLVQWLFYAAAHWEQGLSWGPRYFTESMPILIWMLPPIVERLRTVGRFVFGVACLVAVVIQGIGAFWFTGDALAAAVAAGGPNVHASWKRLAWDFSNTPFIAELSHPRVAPDIAERPQGSIEFAGVLDDDAGRRMQVSGWALMNGLSPQGLTVLVDGEALVGGTATFSERPDVVREVGESGPSGWRVMLPVDGLALGEHTVTALVRGHSGGLLRLLDARTFTVSPPDLTGAAARATAALAERQNSAGYWLTEFSKATQFVPGGQELNIFTDAVVIDVMGPVAQQSGLTENMERARTFLSNQIEDTGLVRYHGRPGLATVGGMGCVITPDADDTSLAWRIAPSDRAQLLPLALSTLKQFRRPDGLYQTWLATRDHYQCLDPGKDPNPADIGIQIHIYLMLAQADPPAARELCRSLQARSADESLWVYYRLAPPIILLRLNDMRKAGCPLQLPASRLQTTIAGQGIWLELLDHLQRFEAGDDFDAGRSQALTLLLSKLADHNFASLTRDPPLLYHNDLSASVSRYYWSQSLGYALWLRLYYENERAKSTALHVADDGGQHTEKGSARP